MFEKKEWHETGTIYGQDLNTFVKTMKRYRVRFYFTPYQHILGGVAYTGYVFATKKKFKDVYWHFNQMKDKNEEMLRKYSSNGMI